MNTVAYKYRIVTSLKQLESEGGYLMHVTGYSCALNELSYPYRIDGVCILDTGD